MTTPTILKTPSNERFLSRNYKQRHPHYTVPSVTPMHSPKLTKTPSKSTQYESSLLFRKRIPVPYGGSEQSDSDEDDDDDPESPSSRRRRSPFPSQCASPFFGAWGTREPKESTSNQPILDDEGLFLVSTAVSTPVKNTTQPRTRTPSHSTTPAFPRLSPLPFVQTHFPQTPAETEWHLGRQTESMTKLSLRDDHGPKRSKLRNKLTLNQFKSSPSPTSRYRGRKRSFDGNELPRTMGDLFESSSETPITTTFRLPGSNLTTPYLPVPTFDSLISSSPCRSQTSLKSNVHTEAPSKSEVEPIPKKYKPRDSGIAGIDDSLDILDTAVAQRLMSDDCIDLVTPSLEPSTHSAWPVELTDPSNVDQLDDIIFKTLATGAAANKDKKPVPGTPVKRAQYAHSRPWMTAAKPADVLRGAGVPRKSLPLSFPSLSQLQNSPDGSPSERSFTQRKPYGILGQGRPSLTMGRASGAKLVLGRRNSSGAFSTSSSEGSLLGTPAKLSFTDKHSPIIPPRSTKVSPRPSVQYLNKLTNEFERPGKFEREFTTLDNLGTGEFGSALKVKSKSGNDDDVYAVKKSKRLEGPKHRRRLREEVDVLRHLAKEGAPDGHPNVLKYIDSWEQDDVLFIQTELCELGDLATFLAEYGSHFVALDEARIWKMTAELINGLQFIHRSGVVHLDIKPANIFITNQGRFRIGDFGMASLWPRKDKQDGFEREGDREYMAPEVLQGRYGPAADMFSLGMILLEATANIVVPDMGNEWHMLRNDNFSAVDFAPSGFQPRSAELVDLITGLMRSKQAFRLTSQQVYNHPVVSRARTAMSDKLAHAMSNDLPVFSASPLGGEPEMYLTNVLYVTL